MGCVQWETSIVCDSGQGSIITGSGGSSEVSRAKGRQEVNKSPSLLDAIETEGNEWEASLGRPVGVSEKAVGTVGSGRDSGGRTGCGSVS